MPRIAEHRLPAEPTSAEQRERYQRMLRAAALIGERHDLEGVQMHDVAREAGVAIATLYRYFPSKTHLFAALLRWHAERLESTYAGPPAGADPVEAVADLLVHGSRSLQHRPRLALAMLQSNNAAHAHPRMSSMATSFRDPIRRAARLDPDDELGDRLVRLLEQSWYGVLVSTLNGLTTMAEAEADLRLVCRLLLAPLAERPAPS